ncbi:hypothetical protein BDK51DRAFT_44658 [Blyttiomyces helicus]|uniref:Uncharacterized protein n=1 Tax=Blyttiomyces helicus TaxID=388810 RepID=A0A4P9WN55_9FUNG|nr:hypothetical protein BDK51DRAFT_44658 [Blyttiomyces helicus]|eukprot:RKO93118.1 hypothetical protein BDK51DRAFT_44658 [Blyttiomyces helicus]
MSSWDEGTGLRVLLNCPSRQGCAEKGGSRLERMGKECEAAPAFSPPPLHLPTSFAESSSSCLHLCGLGIFDTFTHGRGSKLPILQYDDTVKDIVNDSIEITKNNYPGYHLLMNGPSDDTIKLIAATSAATSSQNATLPCLTFHTIGEVTSDLLSVSLKGNYGHGISHDFTKANYCLGVLLSHGAQALIGIAEGIDSKLAGAQGVIPEDMSFVSTYPIVHFSDWLINRNKFGAWVPQNIMRE